MGVFPGSPQSSRTLGQCLTEQSSIVDFFFLILDRVAWEGLSKEVTTKLRSSDGRGTCPDIQGRNGNLLGLHTQQLGRLSVSQLTHLENGNRKKSCLLRLP